MDDESDYSFAESAAAQCEIDCDLYRQYISLCASSYEIEHVLRSAAEVGPINRISIICLTGNALIKETFEQTMDGLVPKTHSLGSMVAFTYPVKRRWRMHSDKAYS